jgi:hypothetical protein
MERSVNTVSQAPRKLAFLHANPPVFSLNQTQTVAANVQVGLL